MTPVENRTSGEGGALFCRVLDRRTAGPGAVVLRFERRGLVFRPGQHLSVAAPPFRDFREYSVYSGAGDDFLEILIKEIPEGAVSPALCALSPGQEVCVWGPLGLFGLPPDRRSRPLLFVATGTGIAPFHSIVRTYPRLEYRLVHGVRALDEAYDASSFGKGRYVSCTSRANDGDFLGRVTGWLAEERLAPDSLVFLCGNSGMISEVFGMLTSRGFHSESILSEVYF